MKTLEQQAVSILKEYLKNNIPFYFYKEGVCEIPDKITGIGTKYSYETKSNNPVLIFGNIKKYTMPLAQCYNHLKVKDYLGTYVPIITVDKDNIIPNIEHVCSNIYKVNIHNEKYIHPGCFLLENGVIPVIGINENGIILNDGQCRSIEQLKELFPNFQIYTYFQL